MPDEIDDANLGETVECKLHGKRRQQKSENLYGHGHAVLIQLLAHPVRVAEYDNIDRHHRDEGCQNYGIPPGRPKKGHRRDLGSDPNQERRNPPKTIAVLTASETITPSISALHT